MRNTVIIQNTCFVTLATVRREGRRSTIKDPVTAGEAGTVSGSRLPGIKRECRTPESGAEGVRSYLINCIIFRQEMGGVERAAVAVGSAGVSPQNTLL